MFGLGKPHAIIKSCGAGARLTVAHKMNAELYGGLEPPSPATILDYRRTKRPPPFERLAAVRTSTVYPKPCLCVAWVWSIAPLLCALGPAVI